MFKKRYNRNIGTITIEENYKLSVSKVCIIGCGGLGGHIIEGLARIGTGFITAVDGDVFDETNLNRQLLSSQINLGKSKAQEAKNRISKINSSVQVTPLDVFLTEENASDIVAGHDAVVDAMDNINGRKILEKACEIQKIPLVHGAIAGWHGQATVIYPGDKTFSLLYPDDENKGVELETGNPSFTPAVVAAIEVAETIKVILKRPQVLRKQLLTIDLLNHQYEVIEI